MPPLVTWPLRLAGALLVAVLALSIVRCAWAQPVCPAAPADPIARDQARLAWARPLAYTDGNTIAASVVLTYTVYERVGTVDTAVCTTTAINAGQVNLAVGSHTWVVSARVGTGPEGPKSNAASKTIAAPPVVPPGAPVNVTVASTRIEPESWTCRDPDGVVLSRHERADKAQESCTNFALANVGTPFEIRPSGYRIVANVR